MKPYTHQQRALDAMESNSKGLIVFPTGGGKTNTFAWDIARNLDNNCGAHVIVAPRILLAQQLFRDIDCQIPNTFQHYFAFSGEAIERENEMLTSEQLLDVTFASCSPAAIISEYARALRQQRQLIIFTTYHTLDKVIESGVTINSAYLDEAHNGTSLQFSSAVQSLSKVAVRMFSFTATPKHGQCQTEKYVGKGNNNSEVYGDIIAEVTAGELVEAGCIVPPLDNYLYTGLVKADIDETSLARDTIKRTVAHYEAVHSGKNHKILVAAPGTLVINELINSTDLVEWANDKGYDVFHTTSKYGDWHNNTRISSRNGFLQLLKQYGKDESKKMLVIHYSILSEGIDVPGMTGVLLLRNMNEVSLTQTIGRVLRMLPVDRKSISVGDIEAGDTHSYEKGYGLVTIPMHKDDGSDLMEKVGILRNVILGMGLRGVIGMSEEEAKGKEPMEVPDDVMAAIRQKKQEVDGNWEWMYTKTKVSVEYADLLEFLN